MFLGTIEPEVRSIVKEHTRAWGVDEYWIGCSGNLTIERFLHGPGVKLHSNDVSIYSCMMGAYFAGDPVELALRDESRELYGDEIEWVDEYMGTDVDRLATMMLGTRFLDYIGKSGRYYTRMLDGTRRQFAEMHAKTVEKIQTIDWRVSSFHPQDVREYLRDTVPADGAVISFPPFDVGGYETMWKSLETHFAWPEPEYEILDDAGITDTLELIKDREHWIFASNHRHEEWEDDLVGVVQTAARRRPNYVYASTKRTRIVRPTEKFEPVLNPRMRKGDVMGDRIALAPLSLHQFNSIRAQYLNPKIRTAPPMASWAVLSDGRVLGAFAVSPGKFSPDEVYLMSDFAVAGSDYKRLSKLIVMAAVSKEAQHLYQNVTSKRVRNLSTTAFTKNPVSMKYRGILDLQKRSKSKDPEWDYELMYGSTVGQWTLDEALEKWTDKWGDTT